MSKIYIWLLRNKNILVLLGAAAYELVREFFEDDPPRVKPPKRLKK